MKNKKFIFWCKKNCLLIILSLTVFFANILSFNHIIFYYLKILFFGWLGIKILVWVNKYNMNSDLLCFIFKFGGAILTFILGIIVLGLGMDYALKKVLFLDLFICIELFIIFAFITFKGFRRYHTIKIW